MNLNNSLVCPVCGGHEFLNDREVFDDRYGYPDLFTLMHCIDCDHLMTTPMLTEDELPKLYGKYYPRKNLSINDIVKHVNQTFSIHS
jgi:hypothetical protein